MTTERALFPELVNQQRSGMPEGFRYEEDIISEADEAALAKSLATLDLKPFEFHGHLGNRRVTSFGLRYDYAQRAVKVTDGFPAFVANLRNKVAKFAGRRVDEFRQGYGQVIEGFRKLGVCCVDHNKQDLTRIAFATEGDYGVFAVNVDNEPFGGK